MSGWSRTTKPSADTTVPANEIFGVDRAEVAANPGVAAPGWVHKTTVGSRTKYEVLVAMKTPPTETADDADIPDFRTVISAQPADRSDASGAAVTFSVTAASVPAGDTLSYAWERSLDSGANWVTVDGTIDGAVYSTFTTDTLNVSANTGLDGYQYRVVISGTQGSVDVTSSAATLTEA